jgi:hypothetical protein
MIPHRIIRDDRAEHAPTGPRAGWVVAREIPGVDGVTGFGKGQVLSAADLPRLTALPWAELHLIEPEANEIHEAEAGLRIARATAGALIAVGTSGGGHWSLTAKSRGLLRVAVSALTAVNDVAGVCVYTRFDGQIVDAGTTVARAKVTPLILGSDAVARAECIAQGAGGLVRVDPFRPAVIGAVVQETLKAEAARRFTSTLADKITWLGSQLRSPVFVPPQDVSIADAVAGVADAGATIIVMAGARWLDPLDPAFLALQHLGVRLERYGVPAHPGSLFWIGHWGTRTLLGLPTCGLFSQLTTFDLILPRLLAGDAVDAHALSALSHGGLIAKDVSFFPPYGANSAY